MNAQEIREALLANGQPVSYGEMRIPLAWFIDYLDGEESDGARFVRQLLALHMESIRVA